MQDEKRWITWRGRRILVNNKGNIIKDGYSLQKEKKKLSRKDLISEVYKGGDGYWNIDLKEGYYSPDGSNYIWAKTKKEAYDILDNIIYYHNSQNR